MKEYDNFNRINTIEWLQIEMFKNIFLFLNLK